MGTRGAIGFLLNGKEKVTYNHFDSYPECLGCEVVDFIKQSNLETLSKQVEKIKLVEEDAKPTKKQQKELAEYANLGVSKESLDDWYCLLRDAQGYLAAYLKYGYMIDNRTFLGDSLYCEFAYIINLDTEVLEFYIGFNKDVIAPGRYAMWRQGEKYAGVRLAAVFPLKEVKKKPKAILKEMIRLSEEDHNA